MEISCQLQAPRTDYTVFLLLLTDCHFLLFCENMFQYNIPMIPPEKQAWKNFNLSHGFWYFCGVGIKKNFLELSIYKERPF
jgi:hypothetical protein